MGILLWPSSRGSWPGDFGRELQRKDWQIVQQMSVDSYLYVHMAISSLTSRTKLSKQRSESLALSCGPRVLSLELLSAA